MPQLSRGPEQHTPNKIECPDCSEKISPDANYCGWCGIRLSDAEE